MRLGAIRSALYLSLIIWLLVFSNSMVPIEKGLEKIMLLRPLTNYYFPTFMLLGLFFPILLRLRRKSDLRSSVGIDSYLILLISQIVNEIIYYNLIGKSITVIIGFIFTIARLFQIAKIKRIQVFRGMHLFFDFQFVLWAINLITITLNRLIPLIVDYVY